MLTFFINIISLFFLEEKPLKHKSFTHWFLQARTVFAQGTSALLCMSLSSANCPSQISSYLMALGSMLMCMWINKPLSIFNACSDIKRTGPSKSLMRQTVKSLMFSLQKIQKESLAEPKSCRVAALQSIVDLQSSPSSLVPCPVVLYMDVSQAASRNARWNQGSLERVVVFPP